MSMLDEWDHKVQLGLGTGSIFILLVIWTYQRLQLYFDSRSRREIPTGSAENKQLSIEERKQQLNKFFEMGKHRLELTMENFSRNPEEGFDIESTNLTEEGDDGHNDDDGDIMEMIHFKIPGEENERICPNCCAICLDPYRVHDVVVWSSSPDCRHVFHQHCLVEGLSRAKNDDTPCPCCRIVFCAIKMEP